MRLLFGTFLDMLELSEFNCDSIHYDSGIFQQVVGLTIIPFQWAALLRVMLIIMAYETH